jgi:hypothetical protein
MNERAASAALFFMRWRRLIGDPSNAADPVGVLL